MENQTKEKQANGGVSVKLMRTKAGRGFKLVVDDKWFYASAAKLQAMLDGERSSCNFRVIENSDPSQGGNIRGDEE
jgi:hypothetical protein